MRFLVVLLTLGALLVPAVAQQNFRAAGKKAATEHAEPASSCVAAPTHVHRFSDMRIAMIEVRSSDDCGFDYVNLEDHTVGPDNHFQYASNFIVARTTTFAPDVQQIQSNLLTRRSIHQGLRGIAIYCSECKAVIMLKLLKE